MSSGTRRFTQTRESCSGACGTRRPHRPASVRSAARAVMTRFVIDPPTLLRLASTNDEVNAKHQLVAPNAIRSQALDLLFRRVLAGDLTERDALDLHERITQLKMRLLGDRVSRRTAWQMAREHGWNTIIQAEYIAVTKLQADALVTVDADLAAKASEVVPLAPLTDLFAD